MTLPRQSVTIVLPCPDGRFSDGDVSRFVGQRFYADIGGLTFAGQVTFAYGTGDRDDDTTTASHVELRVDDPRWAIT